LAEDLYPISNSTFVKLVNRKSCEHHGSSVQ